MKKQLIEASRDSLYTLESDFQRSSKALMQEQETQLLDAQLLETALKESLQSAPPKSSAPKKPKPSLETILKMSSMGYSPEEVLAAFHPNEAGVEGMIDRILQARENHFV